MVLDAGHISIQSDLVPKSELYDIHSKRKRKYTEEDYEKLESLMYDRFFLKLESAQVRRINHLSRDFSLKGHRSWSSVMTWIAV